MAVNGNATRVGLAVVPVKVRCPGTRKTIKTYAFLDNGSTATFCTDALAHKLNAKGKRVQLKLTTVNGQSSSECNLISLEISTLNGDAVFTAPNVHTKPKLPVLKSAIATIDDIKNWVHLEGVNIDTIDANVDLLIGGDLPELHQPYEVKPAMNGGPYATRTALGWVVNGPLTSTRCQVQNCNFICAEPLEEQFKQFCNIEFNDIPTEKTVMSRNDLQALQMMQASTKFKNGHYQVSMPWKSPPEEFPNNKAVALKRLNLLKSRLIKDSTLHTKYTKFMNDLLLKGYAEKALQKDQPRWYLPHHPVLNPQKPGKVRVVFDGSAKYQGVCLNDKLYQGPDLTNTLVGVLLRFRLGPIAFAADIEKMFYQVKVGETDSHYLSYLWWEDGNLNMNPQEYQMVVHLFGGKSSPSCSNFALRKVAKDHAEDFDPVVTNAVNNNFYVDDCLKSVDSEETAIELAKGLKNLLTRGGFNLTKWVSNSNPLVSTLTDSGQNASTSLFGGEQQRALGVHWFVKQDALGYVISPKKQPSTRRGILSVVASVYDPLGLITPFILKELQSLDKLNIRRCYKPSDFGNVTYRELHHFGDASSTSYGAASYLYQKDECGNVCGTLVTAKSRLAPVKTQTIPRLELQAAVLASRLDRIIREELHEIKIDRTVCWTDSTCVLRYLNNEETRFKTFVGNRVTTILNQTTKEQWRHVSSAQNPADLASRGMSAEDMMTSEMWFTGPSFLMEDESEWPQMPTDFITIVEDPEVKTVNAVTVKLDDDRINDLINRFSSWTKLIKVFAWILRWRRRVKNKGTNINSFISVDEWKNAETVIFRYIQNQALHSEVNHLQTNQQVKKGSSLIKLDPIVMNGLMRVGGRLKRSEISDAAKHQIILPKNHHVTLLILRHYHAISGHSGVEHTLAAIRQRFWPIGGRVNLKSVVRRCVKCRKNTAPVMQQKMSDLPADRVKSTPPFTNIGVDCFGPFYVRQGRSSVKRYGIIFTCLTVRAVHLELSSSLDTTSFINALRRFIARRGTPVEIRSDNGGNFVKGNKELKAAIELWNQDQIHQYLLQRHIVWKFNPPLASHFGGVWERCIRTVRKVLSGLIQEQILKEEGLRTLFCEVESIINNRPLTKVSDDPKDSEPLTPNHLLLLRTGSQLPPATLTQDDAHVTRRWRQVQYLADLFWRRWKREYLPSLQERRKWHHKHGNLKVGDVVIVANELTPRNSWPLAVVVEVYTSTADGLVRSAKVKTKMSTLVRPISKLVSLEVASDLF
ncbi:uncharacterized protein [Antedon mediterranea]|uniref:uncharacterized protein n=1 Tax=Antedon mediterranea TaxID=105859 RepID=UPI003AF95737